MPSASNYASPDSWHSERHNSGEMNSFSGCSTYSTKDSQTHPPKPSLSVSKSEERVLWSTDLDDVEDIEDVDISRPAQKATQATRHDTEETHRSRYPDWNRRDPNIAAPSTFDPPSPQLTTSFKSRVEDDLHALGEDIDEDVGDDISNADEETGNGRTQTVSDGLDKKKTRRFRLTHNQTRLLMNEFTRQAHPDATHRERLSREIPGLSPRQVQVWFQNRRAKLKRLTSQDRDKVLRSLALPENFDQTKMLHQPYHNRPPPGSQLSSPRVHRSSFTASSGPKPLAMHISRTDSGDDCPISPSSTTSAYGNYFHSPPSGTKSEILSPTAIISSHFIIPPPTSTLPNITKLDSPRPHPYTRSHSISTPYSRAWDSLSSHRLPLQSPESRTRSESVTTTLRSGTLYTENADDTIPDMISYDGQQLLQRTIPQHNTESPSLQSGLLYQNELIRSGQATGVSRAAPMSDDARESFSSVPDYRHMLPLQTVQLPPSQDYPISPFTPPFNFDSFYPYAQDNSSTMSLPHTRSETAFHPPTEFSYNNGLGRPSTSQPGDTR